MSRKTLVIALVALIASACSSSRQTTEVSSFRVQDSRTQKDSVKVEKVVVEVHDTIMETTTITVDRNEIGDTLKLSTVTERDRIRDRAQMNDRSEMVKVVRDTVYVEKKDSVSTTTNRTNVTNTKGSGFRATLKWLVALLVAVICLVIVIRFNLFKVKGLFNFLK